MSDTTQHESGPAHGDRIHLPASTHWPIVLAFGCTLAAAGLVTNLWISVFGAVIMLFGCVGWFRDVLPHEAHEDVPVVTQNIVIATTRPTVEKLELSPEHRHHLPVETYPVVSGLKGGIVGGIAMVIPAVIYGLLAHGSIWYPINLLGGAGVAFSHNPTTAQIAAFHWSWLLIALFIHATTCVLVGLLYGAMLPMLPRHPIILGGIIAPLIWTGFLHSAMGIMNPVLAARISWGWFAASQFAFGLVAGWIVSRDSRHRTSRHLPLFVRMGIEAPGLMEVNPEAGPRPSAIDDPKESH